MAIEKFKLKGVAFTFDPQAIDAQKIDPTWRERLNPWRKTKYRPGKLILSIRTEPKDIEGRGRISSLIIELVKKGEEVTDVLYDCLMDRKNLDKEFALIDLILENENVKVEGETLIIPREAYYNIAPPSNVGLEEYEKFPVSRWKPRTDKEIDDADDETFDKWVDEYNYVRENHHLVLGFAQIFYAVNSGGVYYEMNRDTALWNKYSNKDHEINNGNDYYSYIVDKTALKDATEAWKTSEKPTKPKEELKDELKRFSAQLINILQHKREEIKKLENIVIDWKQKGNLTDSEYNDKVDNWKQVNDFKIVKDYNNLVNKLNSEDRYKKLKTQFNQESSAEGEPGVSADKDLLELVNQKLEKISENDYISWDEDVLDKKIALKTELKTFKKSAEKILKLKKRLNRKIWKINKRCWQRDSNTGWI